MPVGDIDRLILLLARLPGLGPRSARRAALKMIKRPETLMLPLAGALRQAILIQSRGGREEAGYEIVGLAVPPGGHHHPPRFRLNQCAVVRVELPHRGFIVHHHQIIVCIAAHVNGGDAQPLQQRGRRGRLPFGQGGKIQL